MQLVDTGISGRLQQMLDQFFTEEAVALSADKLYIRRP